MKIYYYKQQENNFALFGKKTSPVRLRYIAVGLLALFISCLCYQALKPAPSATPTISHTLSLPPETTPNSAPPLLQSSALDEETQATSLKIQHDIMHESAEGAVEDKGPTTRLKSQPVASQFSNAMTMHSISIRKHDTLAKIFSRLTLNRKEVSNIMQAGNATEALKKLQPGQNLTLRINNHKVHQLTYNIDPLTTLTVMRAPGDTFKTYLKTAKLEPKQSFTKFTVYSSIAASAKKAGLNGKRIAQLASIFKSSIDFNKGNHTGDKVCVLFQEYYFKDKKVKEGEIVAAEYKTATNTYQAVRFTDPKGNTGYYSPDGASMEKRFLPAPLKFTRISSLFKLNRWHPILHRFRHHQGVDYAAPYGTPIKSVANGTIALLGRKGGYGNTIIIKHDSSYSTLYGHLSNYAANLKVGSYVQQGQLIGYVGSSGLATGPHLHFEFRINGVHRNPLTVALPNGKSITHADRNKFHNEVKKLIAKLDAHKNSSKG